MYKTKIHWQPVRIVSVMATDSEAATEATIREAALCTMCIAQKTDAAPISTRDDHRGGDEV